MAPCNHCQLANQSRREPLRGLSQSKRNLRTTANRMSAFSKHIWLHHECHFGRANQLPTVKANHSLVLLEAPEIVDEASMHVGHGTSYEEWIPLRNGAFEFVKGLAAGVRPLSHHTTTGFFACRRTVRAY